MPVLPVRDKSSGKARATFGDIKLKMVMLLDHCGREEAVEIIAARPEELREQERRVTTLGVTGFTSASGKMEEVKHNLKERSFA